MPFLGKTPTKLLDANVNIDGGNIDGTTIGATSAASATVTTFTSTGIDDNATSTAITIDSSGQVIISGNGGSTVNSLDLTYNGSSGQANIQADSDGGDTFLTFGTSASGAVAEHMRITSSGNVGIGTASPVNTASYGGATINGTTGGIFSLAHGDTENTRLLGTAARTRLSAISGPLEFSVGGVANTKMTINSSGNVGIGTTSPSFSLEIGNGTASPVVSILSGTTNTGNIYFGDGTSGADQYRGVIRYDHTNDFMSYWTGASERMRIDSSGNVGIGTSSPSMLLGTGLHIDSTGYTSIVLQKGGAGQGHNIDFTDASNALQYRIGTNFASGGENLLFAYGSTPTIGMTLDSSGNVGLGVTPSAWGSGEKAFQILGNTYGGGVFASGNNVGTIVGANAYWDGTQYKRINATSVSLMQFSGGATYFYRDGTGAANSIISLTSSMTINSSGKVQIGTNAGNFTDALLTTRQAGNVIDWGHGNTAGYGSTLGSSSGSGAPFIGFSCGAGTNSNTFKTTGIAGSLIQTDNAGSLLFSRVTTANADNQSATESMRIDSSGRLLIGKTATSNSSNGYFLETGSGGYASFVNSATASSNRNILCNRHGGNGDTIQFRRANVQVGSISVTTSATTYNTSSDARLKENIVNASSASDDIDAIQVRSFNWKADGSHQKYGMVAQELVTVAPEAVTQPEDSEEMMSVDYSKLVPMMIKEIQDLRARVAQLEGA